MRHRLLSIVVLAGMLGALLVAGPAAKMAGAAGPTRTRIRVVLTNNAAWSTVEFFGGAIAALHVAEKSPGAEFYHDSDAVGLKGAVPGSATVDMVLDVPASIDPIKVIVAKDKWGSARTQVFRNNSAVQLAADITNSRTDGDATVIRYVGRDALIGEGLQIPRLDPRRLTLAFYYPWYEAWSFSSGPWYDKPSSPPWRTDDATEVRQMVDQAAGANIDGFVVSWDGIGDRARRLDLVFNAANARGNFHVSLLLELLRFKNGDGQYDLAKIEQVLRLGLQRASNPSFLRVNGRPVVFVYGLYEFGLANWKVIRSRLAATGDNPYLIGGVTDPAFGMSGMYWYNPGGLSDSNVTRLYAQWAQTARLRSQVDPTLPQRLWAATVSPGMNDSYFHQWDPWNASVVSRRGGDRYGATWNASVWSSPEWILITSWNEYPEATHIQPSQRFGTTALDQTRSWSAGFKGITGTGGGAAAPSGGLFGLPLLRESSALQP